MIASLGLLGGLGLAPAQAQAQGAARPPHAWLFGEWTGGMFPPPSHINAEACEAQPTVIFTRDLVLRATLTDITLVQREVETARATETGFEFRLRPAAAPAGPAASMLDLGSPAQAAGFGCDDPNALHVQRRGDNEISFPGCQDFPYPLVRCTAR